MSQIVSEDRKAYIITGPTSGVGRATALKMAKHGTLVLVGRNSVLARIPSFIAIEGTQKGAEKYVTCAGPQLNRLNLRWIGS